MMPELISLAMRYVFLVLGILIALRALLSFKRDADRYKKEMRRLPDAGYIGELRLESTGKTYPIPREGDMGRGFSCDIRLKGKGIGRHHAAFAYVPGKGLRITSIAGKIITLDGKRLRGRTFAINGSYLVIGQNTYRVLFFQGVDVPNPARMMAYDSPEAVPDWGEQTEFPIPDEQGWGEQTEDPISDAPAWGNPDGYPLPDAMEDAWGEEKDYMARDTEEALWPGENTNDSNSRRG